MKLPQCPRHELFDDDEFKKIVVNSSSIDNLMKNLGYKSRSSFDNVVKSRCDRLGLDIPKFVFKTHTDEEVIEVAKKSKSITDTMRKLGLKPNGYAHARFKIRLQKLGFEWNDASAWNRGIKTGKKRPIECYLVIDGPQISSSHLRKRLISEGLKEARCEICNITEWNGEPAPLQLDHKNGTRKDCRLENLRICCANCHALTPTHSKRKSHVSVV